MTLIKTSLLNGIAVIIKMLTLLGLNKLLAVYVGPSGYAVIGQFQNAIQMIATVASGAINTGVTKYTSEYYDDEIKQRNIWVSAGTIALVGSVLTALAVFILNEALAGWLLKDESLYDIFSWFAATLVFFVFNSLFLAILNGKKEVQLYVIANISGSVFSLVFTSAMVFALGLRGALISLAIYQSLTFFVTTFLIYKTSWFKFRYLFGRIDRESVNNLAKYTVMAITTAACVPVSHILIRNHLGETLGWDAAGYWEAMWRLSAAYLMLVTTTLSVYYLPRFSEIRELDLIKKEIKQGYMIILPAVAACGVAIYVLRWSLIEVLFSNDFAGMEVMFGWQVFGDAFKIGSWVLAYLMLGKALVKVYVVTEVGFSIFFYVLVLFLTSNMGLEGVSAAYAVNYLIYWVVMGWVYNKYSS